MRTRVGQEYCCRFLEGSFESTYGHTIAVLESTHPRRSRVGSEGSVTVNFGASMVIIGRVRGLGFRINWRELPGSKKGLGLSAVPGSRYADTLGILHLPGRLVIPKPS